MSESPQPRPRGGVQSVERSVALLSALSDAGGRAGLVDLTTATELPVATVHRLLRTLQDLGLVRQTTTRDYALGPRLIGLGENASRSLGIWARPHLARLVAEVGETANLAMLDRDKIVYIAQVPSPHSMRMFTEVGRRVDLHCTGVGKALLAQMPDTEGLTLLDWAALKPMTEHTITTEASMRAELERIRQRGYAVDDGEQEIGVRCVSMAINSPEGRYAVSVSGPTARVCEERDAQIVPALRAAASAIAAELQSAG